MKKRLLFIFYLITCGIPFALFSFDEELLNHIDNEEKALYLRRIAAFWEDKQFDLAKNQIENYLAKFSQDEFYDYFLAVLGNIALEEGKYAEAISMYEKVQKETLKDKVTLNSLLCLCHLKWYDRLKEECKIYLEKYPDDNTIQLKIKLLLAQAEFLQITENKNSSFKEDLEKSKLYFEEFLGGIYENEAIEYLSQIHISLGQHEEAANYYLNLSEKVPTKREEYLYQAASLQACFDKEKAIASFSKLMSLNHPKNRESAYNYSLLLFELQDYEKLLQEKDAILNIVSAEKLPLIQYFIGSSFFYLKDYQNAIKYLEPAITAPLVINFDAASITLMLLKAYFEINDVEKFNTLVVSHFKYLSDNNKKSQTLFAKALLNKNNTNYETALDDFEKLFNMENANLQPLFYYEYGRLLFDMKNFSKARELFSAMLEKFKETNLRESACSYLINSSLCMLQNAPLEETCSIKQNLITDISSLINDPSLSKNDVLSYQLLSSKIKLEENLYDDVINALEPIAKNENFQGLELPNNQKSEILLTLGLAYKTGKQDLQTFCKYLEYAQTIDPELEKNFNFQINLFNAYIEISAKEEDYQKYLAKAADHLFAAYNIDRLKLLKNNVIWLANYYYQQFKQEQESASKNELSENFLVLISKAETILENLLADFQNDDTHLMEAPILKLANIKKFHSLFDKEISLLEKIVNEYRFALEKFNFKEQAIYELCLAYEKIGKNEKAIKTYAEFSKLFAKDNRLTPFATLHQCRLKLATIEKDNFVATNAEIETIVNQLKNLQIQKHVESEPAHLEAALEYVDLLCKLEHSLEKKVFLLMRAKDNFSIKNDVLSNDYHTIKKTDLKKNDLYLAYMMLIDAEIMIHKALLEKKDYLLQEAKALFKKLKDDCTITQFLDKRIDANLKLIEEEEIVLQ